MEKLISTHFIHSIQKANNSLLFVFICVVTAFLFSYPVLINLAPQTLHLWRQSDCLAFALNYYEGQSFFQPRVYNYLNDNGLCAGECPLIYFVVGKIWQITGVQYWIFRAIQLCIFYAGAWALFNLSAGITKSRSGAFFILINYLSAPLVMVYAPGYLADVPSLSFTWLGLWSLYLYQQKNGTFLLISTSLFFLIAMLLKANAMFLPIAIVLAMLLTWLKITKGNTLLKFDYKIIIALCVAIFLQYQWYAWVITYTTMHHSAFLGTGTWPGWPIWEASAVNISNTFKMLLSYSKDIFSFINLFIIFIGLFIVAKSFKKRDAFCWLIMAYLGAVVCFLAYFFVGFKDNNYYFVNLYVLPFLILIYLVYVNSKHFDNKGIQILMVLMVVFNLGYAYSRMQVYFYDGKQHQKLSEVYYKPEFRNFIDKHIPLKAQVISFPDETPNATLSIIQRHGVSQYGFREGKINQEDMEMMINRGFQYYLCNNNFSLTDSNLTPHLGGLVAQIKTLSLYKLK